MGPEMMQHFRDQAERFGTRFITDDATRIELAEEDGGIHRVYVGDQEIRARAVILAMGAEPKKLGVPGEDELAARGVSYCATCDAAFFRDKHTIVVGGGDTAMEDATFLAKFAGKVSIVHRRDEFRASAIMLDRARETENIEFLTPYVVERFEAGDNGVARQGRADERRRRLGARARDRPAPSSRIGHRPNSQLVEDQLEIDENGYVAGRGPLHPHRASRACSPPATSPTTSTARPSPRRARAACPRSTPRPTCATRRSTPRPTGPRIRTRSRPRRARAACGLGLRRRRVTRPLVGSHRAHAFAQCAMPGGWRRAMAGASARYNCRVPEIWTNWAGEQRCAPERVERPRDEEELARVVRGRAGGAGRGLGPLVHRHRLHRRRARGPRAHETRARGGRRPT